MLRRLGARLRGFFFPSADAPTSVRLRPYLALGVLTIVFLLLIPIGWDYTNSPEFCGTSCHGEAGLSGLNRSSYNAALAGGLSGAAFVPGDPDASLAIIKQTTEVPHFAQLDPQDMALLNSWIEAGAPEG